MTALRIYKNTKIKVTNFFHDSKSMDIEATSITEVLGLFPADFFYARILHYFFPVGIFLFVFFKQGNQPSQIKLEPNLTSSNLTCTNLAKVQIKQNQIEQSQTEPILT